MEQIAVILLVLTVVSAVLESSFFRKAWHVAVFAVVCGAVVFGFYPVAIEQNKMILKDVLSNRTVLLNIALVLTVESLVFIGVNIYQLQQYHGEPSKVKPWLRLLIFILSYFPGLFFFGSLFYFEVQVFLLGLHIGFASLAAIMAASVTALILAAHYAVKRLLPEKDLRLEINYFLHFVQIILAAVIAAGAADGAYFHNTMPADWMAIAGVAGIVVVGCSVGYVWYRIKKMLKR